MVQHGWMMLCLSSWFACLGVACSDAATGPSLADEASLQSGQHADWPTLAMGDLRAMHDLIRDNHPGPVDAGNPQFNAWLEAGLAEALPLAEAAHSRSDHEYALRVYANGFADGHLGVRFPPRNAALWPGFLTTTDARGITRVSVTAPGALIPLGAALLGCDGEDAAALLHRRVQCPLANPAVPQRLGLASPWLMIAADDAAPPFARCRFDEAEREIDLRWQPISSAALQQRITEAQGILRPPLGLREVAGVWFVSLPSFQWTGADLARMQAFLADLNQHAAQLHEVRHVVIDLRGNDGGDSLWGEAVASALWGRDHVSAVEDSLDGSVEWRVSERNATAVQSDAAAIRAEGQAEAAEEFSAIAAKIAALSGTGTALLPAPEPVGPAPEPFPSPFQNPVYVLTEPHCASACLDFMDLLRRLPGVVQVGLPTSADTTYLELASAPLPSGQATLAYAMKVYRNRARRNNEWHDPAIPWPGGAMTDEAVAAWIASLP